MLLICLFGVFFTLVEYIKRVPKDMNYIALRASHKPSSGPVALYFVPV